MDISSGKAMFVSLITGGPSLAVATFNSDFVPVATGAAVGIVMFLWSVRNTSNDQYVKSLHERLQESQDDIKKLRDTKSTEIEEIRSTLVEVQLDLKRLKVIQDAIQKQLAIHSCPVAVDPNVKCRLPEILSSTLSM